MHNLVTLKQSTQDFDLTREDEQTIYEIISLLKKKDKDGTITIKYAQQLLHYCAEDLPSLISLRDSKVFQYT